MHIGTRHNGETITGQIRSVASLAIGDFLRRDVGGAFAPPNGDGLLSMDFFRDQPFTLDLKAGRLTIEPPSRMDSIAAHAAAIPIRLKLNGPQEVDLFVRVCVGGRADAESECDTGDAPSTGTTHQFVGLKDGLIYQALIGHGALRDKELTIDIPGRRMLVW